MRGVSHTKIRSSTAIVGRVLKNAVTGRINAANGLKATATHAHTSARTNEIKNAVTVRASVCPRARQKSGSAKSEKNCFTDKSTGAIKYSFLTTAAASSHTTHIKAIAASEKRKLSFFIEEIIRGRAPRVRRNGVELLHKRFYFFLAVGGGNEPYAAVLYYGLCKVVRIERVL